MNKHNRGGWLAICIAISFVAGVAFQWTGVL